jgi:hypothetical protein
MEDLVEEVPVKQARGKRDLGFPVKVTMVRVLIKRPA